MGVGLGHTKAHKSAGHAAEAQTKASYDFAGPSSLLGKLQKPLLDRTHNLRRPPLPFTQDEPVSPCLVVSLEPPMDRSAINTQSPGYDCDLQPPVPDESYCGQIPASCVTSTKVVKPHRPNEHHTQVSILHKLAPTPNPHTGYTRWWGQLR